MKRNATRWAAGFALIGAAAMAHADPLPLSPADLPYDLGADPTAEDSYSVFHEAGSFSDVFRFALSGPNDIAARTILSGAEDHLNGQQRLTLVSDFEGNGVSDGDAALLSVAYEGDGFLLARNLAAGAYYFQLSGMATGAQGGNYLFSASVAPPVPEPESYALMLAGLGLLGFVGKRRLQRSVAGFA